MEEDEGISNYYIWTHKKFDIGYNGKQIVDVNLTSENKVKLKLNAKIPFTYEVNWKKSSVKFEDRFDKYLDPNFFQHRVSTFYGAVLYIQFIDYVVIVFVRNGLKNLDLCSKYSYTQNFIELFKIDLSECVQSYNLDLVKSCNFLMHYIIV